MTSLLRHNIVITVSQLVSKYNFINFEKNQAKNKDRTCSLNLSRKMSHKKSYDVIMTS